MDLPTGTVTFLFTDIEGSTKLWEEHPEPMRQALARHDALLREAIQSHSGVVFKTMGDAFCAVFATAPAALNAALAAQCALTNEAWETPVPLRVRMALHTGLAEQRDNDYFGSTLNRVARLLAAGHGGQTLVSASTRELVRDPLPAEASLQDLGQVQLPDLARPQKVFQLLHPSLPADFPPLRSLDNPALPNNLPVQLTSFIGRETEMIEVARLLSGTRLLTLTGSGGCGKTRLALQVAANLLPAFREGVWVVDLAPLSDPALVPQALALALNVREEPGRPLMQTLSEYLKPKSVLLLLDNCEHLLSACVELADALLRACPDLRILATSREGLGMAGETTWRVPSLSLPDLEHLPPAEILSRYEAVQLFMDRATAALPAFKVTKHNASAVAQVSHRLDGIPLAIELAAVRVKMLPVEQIAARLDDRFRLLTGGSRTALPRQQTLRAAIDWSYNLLHAPEKVLLCRLSAFAGGWTLEAAEAVCAGDEQIQSWEVLDLLSALIEKSLVVYEEQEGAARYRLLETVRQYARDRLLESGEGESVRDRHLDFFARLAEEAREHWDHPTWVARLEAEHDNARAALTWSQAAERHAEAGLRLAWGMSNFWIVRSHFWEGREWMGAALQRSSGVTPSLRAKAFCSAGWLVIWTSEYAAARDLFQKSLEIARELGDREATARALNGLGTTAHQLGEYAESRARQEESLALSRELGDQDGIDSALGMLGWLARDEGDFTRGRALELESMALSRSAGARWRLAMTLTPMGDYSVYEGDFEAARALYEEGLGISRDLGDKRGIGRALVGLGRVARMEGDLVTARTLCEESLELVREVHETAVTYQALCELGFVALEQGDHEAARSWIAESLSAACREARDRWSLCGVAEALEGFARLAVGQGQTERAARLFGAADGLREAVHVVVQPANRPDYDRSRKAAHTGLGEEAFAAAWAEGRAMTLEQAVAYALEEPQARALTG